jgi:predicted transport protein
MLKRDSFADNQLLNYAKNLFIYTNVKSALENIFQNPSRKVIEQINEKIRMQLGHRFGDDEVKKALRYFLIEISDDICVINGKEESKKTKEIEKPPISTPVLWKIEDQFNNGKWETSFNLYKKLKNLLEKNNIPYVENPTKYYIGMKYNNKNYFFVCGQKRCLKLYFRLKWNELSEQEKLIERDVSKIGYSGLGDIECTVNNENDFEWLIGIIRKAYNKIS